jgi:hypothetical protein
MQVIQREILQSLKGTWETLLNLPELHAIYKIPSDSQRNTAIIVGKTHLQCTMQSFILGGFTRRGKKTATFFQCP